MNSNELWRLTFGDTTRTTSRAGSRVDMAERLRSCYTAGMAEHFPLILVGMMIATPVVAVLVELGTRRARHRRRKKRP